MLPMNSLFIMLPQSCWWPSAGGLWWPASEQPASARERRQIFLCEGYVAHVWRLYLDSSGALKPCDSLNRIKKMSTVTKRKKIDDEEEGVVVL